MRREYFETWKARMEDFQKPLREIITLNVEAFQKLNYLKPEELSQLKKPEDFLEKNVQIFIQNSHQALDYLQKVFNLYEKDLLMLMKDFSLYHALNSPFSNFFQTKKKKHKKKLRTK